MRSSSTQGRLAASLRRAGGVYERHRKKLDRLFGLPADHPLDAAVRAGEARLAGLAHALEGGELPPPEEGGEGADVAEAFRAAEERRRERKEREGKTGGKAEKQKGATETRMGKAEKERGEGEGGAAVANGEKISQPHLVPLFPPMPPHTQAVDLFGEGIITDTLSHGRPTVAGVIAILQRFLARLHAMLVAKKHAPTPDEVIEAYFALVDEYLLPLEDAYRDRPVFPVREDGSIFMSLGAYRDHLLGETLRQAFKNAADPDRLFVGAVVQNCFGIDVQCRTGVEVVGSRKGQPVTQVSDKDPDVNGVAEFCADPDYVQYCERGHVRALYGENLVVAAKVPRPLRRSDRTPRGRPRPRPPQSTRRRATAPRRPGTSRASCGGARRTSSRRTRTCASRRGGTPATSRRPRPPAPTPRRS